MHKVKYIGGSLIILLVFWQIVTWLGGWNEALFPSPLGTVRGLGELLASGVCWLQIFVLVSADLLWVIGLGDFSYLASHLCAVRVILIRLQVFYVYWSERTA